MGITPTDEVCDLAALLKEKGLKLAVAESCTGGLLGARITSLAGSTDYFTGGVISYANSVKTELLGVPEETIKEFGAVSRECAKLMALGVRERLKSDLGLSITGVAGPGGGTKEKPVGTVFIALSREKLSVSVRLFLKGTRGEVREQAASFAVRLAIKELRSEPS
ncbi:MAG: CinA family protein [Proteobacteria bacterium]|nr:CinA family protein [Pseudomonadota bacterium]